MAGRFDKLTVVGEQFQALILENCAVSLLYVGGQASPWKLEQMWNEECVSLYWELFLVKSPLGKSLFHINLLCSLSGLILYL